MSKFVHLHIHSEFSLLDGANRIKDLPVRAKELGMKAMAITDHGVMYGAIDFYKACKKEGIKPIIGCEVYVAPRSRFDKEPIDKQYYHLILLAKNNQGYKNLSKLVSIGFTEGYYYKPRIDLEVLEKYHEGLICLSACLAGAVNQALLNGQTEKAEEIALWHKRVFGEDYYIEIQNNGIREQVLANQKLVQLARKLDIPLVATNDAHYLKREDAYSHEILLCIQTGKRMSDEDRMKFDTDELYVKSPEEMSEYFSAFPDAIENTVKIADKCNVEFEFGHTILPNYDVPPEYPTHYDFLKKLCDDGIKERYGENPSEEILKRAEYEIGVIKKMGYVDYYLIVWDFIHYAKSQGIPVGPGRGSGAGSILAYAIGITDIDPMKYGLLFERFLNPERVSMPDFDVDFCYEHRQDVIDYVSRKYGHDHVSQIITFGTMAAKMVIRDVARVLDYPYSEADRLAKMIPNEIHITIPKALEQNKELKEAYELDDNVHKLLDIAMALEGMPRQASTHACGVVITKDPVDTYVPLYVRDNQISTQYIMTTLEELGLLKMDFLGLRTLTVIKDTINLVKKDKGIDVEFDQEMSDPKVYKLWQEGKTSGIFQFESQGMTNFMKELKPDCLEDLIAGVSLYRPGPMDQIPRYIRGKLNPGHNEYTHPALEPILNVTYGCMVYQEQVMQIVRDLAGYSLGRADLVRRAMGKKKMDVMEEERRYFVYGKEDENGNIEIAGCIRNGVPEDIANQIFDDMIDFAKYAFNKSHAAAYGVLSYQTAYLKAYYPVEFMAALITSVMGNTDKVVEYIRECNALGIEVLKPDINKSFSKFSVEGNNIRFGLAAVKNVGVNIIENIINERNLNGEFVDFSDLAKRLDSKDTNKRVIESLIKCGAFDEISENRASLMAGYENVLDSISMDRKKNVQGQISLFDVFGASEENNLQETNTIPKLPEYQEREKLSLEKEVLGMYVSGHPLSEFKEILTKNTSIDNGKLNSLKEDEESYLSLDERDVIMGGMIANKTIKTTKRNDIMAFLDLEDLYGNIEVIVFPQTLKKYNQILNEDSIIFIRGVLNIKEGEEPKIVARDIVDIDNVYQLNRGIYDSKKHINNTENHRKNSKNGLYLKVDSYNNLNMMENISNILKRYPGEENIFLYAEDTKKLYKYNGFSVTISDRLITELNNILPKENIKIR